MCKISVLMSIYNESDKEIYEAISSIINQTVRDFELIIIVDNPQKTDFSDYLLGLGICDDRIRIVINETNIGLAESMNKAFSLSEGKYIARMDADDIAFPTRFEEEVKVLDNNSADLVCTDYVLIDEDSHIINQPTVSYSNHTLTEDLNYGNTIHHPTVMMKREVLEAVKGYRNFPCSQDYDLWLRIKEYGGRFAIINKPLLQYRIRSNSISESKSFRQIATIWYIKNLCRERKKRGKDSFSTSNYNDYLERLKLNDEEYLEKCNRGKAYKKKIEQVKSQSKIKALMMMVRLFLCNDFYRKLYLNNISEVLGMKLNHLRNRLG